MLKLDYNKMAYSDYFCTIKYEITGTRPCCRARITEDHYMWCSNFDHEKFNENLKQLEELVKKMDLKDALHS